MKKVLFFVASLLVVTACNNANNDKVNETSDEQAAVETRACEENCDEDSMCRERECDERCDEDGVCNERHDNCDRREDCTVRHRNECDSRRDCDTHNRRHSDCRDSRHNSRHCNDRC